MKLIVSLLTLVAIGLGGWIWKERENLVAERESHARALAMKDEETQASLSKQAEQHQKQIQTLTDEHERTLDDLRKSQREQIASAYKEFENIFDGNRKTVDYINLLESKIKGGQAISRAEVEKLAVITTGLGYLKKQYAKPLEQFTELETFFAKQSAMQPEKPKAAFGFFKRMFSKEFREAEREYYREEGEKRAFEEAKGKFDIVYKEAQATMAAVNIDTDKQIQKLYTLIEEKQQANAEDLSSFFDQARKALRTHQEVLKFEPENLPPPTPRP
jgi:hypothetical protein